MPVMSKYIDFRKRQHMRLNPAVIRARLVVCVLLTLLSVALPAQAQDTPSRESIAQQLEQLESSGSSAPSVANDIQLLRESLAGLDRAEVARRQLQALDREIEEAPRRLSGYRQALRALDQDGALPSQAQLERASLEQLEQRLIDSLGELKQEQDAQGDATRRITAAQTLPERAQASIGSAQGRIQQLRTRLRNEGDQLGDIERRQLEIEVAALEAEVELSRRELINNTLLRDLAQAHRELLARQVEARQAELALIQSAVTQKRREKSQRAIEEAREGASPSELDNPLVREVTARNSELSESLLYINELIRDGIETRSQLDAVQQVQSNLNDQVEAVRGSVLLSRILRQQRESLPVMVQRPALNDEIADLRLRQFDLAEARESLGDVERYVDGRLDALIPSLDPATRETVRHTLLSLYESQRELLEQLDREYGNLLTLSIDIQLNQQQLSEIGTSVRATIDEQLFWIASGQPLGLNWLKQLPSALYHEVVDPAWRQVLRALFIVPSLWIVSILPMLALVMALSFYRTRIRQQLRELHDEVGRIKRDSQRHTPLALLLNLVLAIRGPLLLASAGAGLRLSGSTSGLVLGGALLTAAFAWGYFAWARRILINDGVAMRHFHWPAAYVARLRRLISHLGVASVPVVLVIYLIQHFDSNLVDQPVGLLIVLFGYLMMSVLLFKLILAHVPYLGVKLVRLGLGLAMALVPLVLGGLVLYGYEYTAVRLTTRFITSLYVFGLWVLVEATVVRGLAVAARRLAYRRSVERRRALIQAQGGEAVSEVLEEPPLDMDQVNKQSLRLSKMVLFLVFIAFLYLVWHDLLGVLSYLNNINVWQVEQSEGGVQSVAHVSLASLFIAVITIALMTTMARNLPGLLEVMVLSKLELKTGSAYAISSLLSYIILSCGIVVALGTLGLSWSKLQWLVAALGVGLGFGLQEIFANFISGLIILFERPIRIGDTITLNDLHGTVSRIRMRATTVIDFDRKEIIVPNKTFITDRLINWSLSDNITRVVLTYGVAHGSDLDRVHQMLMQIARDNPLVLEDPEPLVFCMAYGNSSFTFEVRVFVSDIGDRLRVTDQINRAVDAAFKREGVRVAFQQMDVWLHRERDGDKGRKLKGLGIEGDSPGGAQPS